MKYLVTSDIHLGHKRTPTEHIIANFKKYIFNDENKDIDVLFINGDLFDRLLDLNSSEVHEIIVFFNILLDYCYKNNIYLRVLEGTPSHDWQQNHVLVKMNDIRENKVNLKYFKVLDIEYIDRISKYVLYIPDEWINDHNELEKQIENKLKEHNIDKVDMAMLHGQFEYQIKGHKNVFYFKENYFLSKVKSYIHIGHHHVYSKFDRIIANGSFERLAFGEESPKGYVVVYNNDFKFIENLSSYVYKTFLIEKEKELERVFKEIEKLPKNSYIRLQINENINYDYNAIKLRYSDYIIKIVKIHELVNSMLDETEDSIEIETFSIENLKSYLYSNITSKNNLNETLEILLKQYLDKFIVVEN